MSLDRITNSLAADWSVLIENQLHKRFETCCDSSFKRIYSCYLVVVPTKGVTAPTRFAMGGEIAGLHLSNLRSNRLTNLIIAGLIRTLNLDNKLNVYLVSRPMCTQLLTTVSRSFASRALWKLGASYPWIWLRNNNLGRSAQDYSFASEAAHEKRNKRHRQLLCHGRRGVHKHPAS
jgi:hypothetical protein